MMGHKICFYREIWPISVLPLLIWSTGTLFGVCSFSYLVVIIDLKTNIAKSGLSEGVT